tara:strand:+ start:67 stop:285 length:219 start_codon:yes stop_codon:yes gene_type:complete
MVRRAYATGSLDGNVVKANQLLSRRELKSVEYLSRLSPELRALVQKARRTPQPAANPIVHTALPPQPSAPVK